jgi:hypothetical protein
MTAAKLLLVASKNPQHCFISSLLLLVEKDTRARDQRWGGGSAARGRDVPS